MSPVNHNLFRTFTFSATFFWQWQATKLHFLSSSFHTLVLYKFFFNLNVPQYAFPQNLPPNSLACGMQPTLVILVCIVRWVPPSVAVKRNAYFCFYGWRQPVERKPHHPWQLWAQPSWWRNRDNMLLVNRQASAKSMLKQRRERWPELVSADTQWLLQSFRWTRSKNRDLKGELLLIRRLVWTRYHFKDFFTTSFSDLLILITYWFILGQNWFCI